jgi:hypothetical protein
MVTYRAIDFSICAGSWNAPQLRADDWDSHPPICDTRRCDGGAKSRTHLLPLANTVENAIAAHEN